MDTITIERDNELDLRFHGKLIAEVASSNRNPASNHSGDPARWTTLRIYKIEDDICVRYVCESIGHTNWSGEHDRHSAAVCYTEAEVIEFFGKRWLAKQLYAAAGIEAVEIID